MSEKEKESVKPESNQDGISRRDVLLGMGAAASMAYAGSAAAVTSKEHDHSKHSTQLPVLMDAVNDCVEKGRSCIAHCMVSFQEGDLDMADCASKVHEMQAVCEGFAYLVASNSSYTKEFSKVCEKVCTDCAKECRKHEEHKECKACAIACENIVDAIKLSLS